MLRQGLDMEKNSSCRINGGKEGGIQKGKKYASRPVWAGIQIFPYSVSFYL